MLLKRLINDRIVRLIMYGNTQAYTKYYSAQKKPNHEPISKVIRLMILNGIN